MKPDAAILFVARVIEGEAVENWILESPVRPLIGEILVIERRRLRVTSVELDFPQRAFDGKYPYALTFVAVEEADTPSNGGSQTNDNSVISR